MTTVTADLGGKNYVLGKGKVFFDRFASGISVVATTQGEGERYLGNTPEFSTSGAAQNLDHFSSDSGVKVKDDSVQLSLDRTGKMTCDNIQGENIGLFFLGSSATVAQSALTGQISTLTAADGNAAKRGRFYQLGVTTSTPAGLRKVKNVVVKKGAGFTTTVTLAGNYQVDSDLGRLYIEASATDIPDNTDLQVTFDTDATSFERTISGTASIYGALRFVADNPKGANRDYYFPYVKLAPDGDYALKGDDWQKVGFTFEILKKADNIEAAYIDGRPA